MPPGVRNRVLFCVFCPPRKTLPLWSAKLRIAAKKPAETGGAQPGVSGKKVFSRLGRVLCFPLIFGFLAKMARRSFPAIDPEGLLSRQEVAFRSRAPKFETSMEHARCGPDAHRGLVSAEGCPRGLERRPSPGPRPPSLREFGAIAAAPHRRPGAKSSQFLGRPPDRRR